MRNDSFDDATLSIEEEDLLDQRLDWIGRLGRRPNTVRETAARERVLSEATTSAMVCTVAMMVGTLAIITGFVLTVLAIRRWKRGRVCEPLREPVRDSQHLYRNVCDLVGLLFWDPVRDW